MVDAEKDGQRGQEHDGHRQDTLLPREEAVAVAAALKRTRKWKEGGSYPDLLPEGGRVVYAFERWLDAFVIHGEVVSSTNVKGIKMERG